MFRLKSDSKPFRISAGLHAGNYRHGEKYSVIPTAKKALFETIPAAVESEEEPKKEPEPVNPKRYLRKKCG